MIYNIGAGSAGALVHLNITYDTDFIGETITVTNGTETHTFIGDATLNKVVNCQNLGEWTVSCGEYEASATVIYYGKYNIDLYASVAINVYSAPNDTVFYYPNNDTTQNPIVVCTTDATGQGRGASPVSSNGIVFYSTVAKDTTNATTNYSKNIIITPSTTEISVMPDKALYWYGIEKTTFEAVGYTYGDYQRAYAPQITKATNEIVLTTPSDGTVWTRVGAYKTDVNMSGYTSANVVVSNTPIAKLSTSDWRNQCSLMDGENSSNNINFTAGITNKAKYSIPTSNTGKLYLRINACDNTGTLVTSEPHLHALWLE